jgi:hypothetical protein
MPYALFRGHDPRERSRRRFNRQPISLACPRFLRAQAAHPDHGEFLITRQLACERGRNSRISKRSAEDSPVGMQPRRMAGRASGHLVRRGRAAGCSTWRIDSASDAGQGRSRRTSGRDTEILVPKGSDEPLDERMGTLHHERLNFLERRPVVCFGANGVRADFDDKPCRSGWQESAQ